ncbi:hypothetical protein G7Y89_g9717 [Cudoniella acicularis]|uniref:Uncharacterized protein n=1 Tax=Cudoniella acicularis TaxID=354080 RepID=A0A8H4RHU0_9HELO|nr:hypothetical protein G7Y89_g9717 [Cudoniella acicularis]
MRNMNAPVSVEQFWQIFPNWPDDSISQRKDPIRSGSSWGIREIGTFQAFREPPTDRVPLFLEGYWAESESRVSENVDFQALFRLLASPWRALNHEQIQKTAGPFASFLSALSQVMENPIAADTDRLMRERVQSQLTDLRSDQNVPASGSSRSQETPPPFGSSPPEQEYPSKRFRADRSSGSYVPSDPESDQSIYDQRAKSEFATNFCMIELLRCVTELSRKNVDPSHRMEWGIAPNTFTVQAGQHQFSSTNDGGLVNRAARSGHWQRVSEVCYCSLEAKSWYSASGKLDKGKAQETAHLVGMFSQRVQSQGLSEQDIVYDSFLIWPFRKRVEEFGVFRLQDPTELRTICTAIIALTLQTQDLIES